MKFDNLYFNSYVNSLLELESIDEINSSLPSPNQDGYEEFITNLINFINNEINSNEELKNECNNNDDLLLINQELKKLNQIRNILIARLNDITKEEKIPSGKKNLIFLTTSAGNPCIEKDLKEIPKEYFDSLADLFERLENFGEKSGEFNDTLCKKLTSNCTFKDVFEMKNFKVRLYFEQLDKDNLLVLMSRFKNQTTSKYIDEVLESRVRMPVIIGEKKLMVDLIKETLSNPLTRNSLIKKNNDIKDSILNKLRGKKK